MRNDYIKYEKEGALILIRSDATQQEIEKLIKFLEYIKSDIEQQSSDHDPEELKEPTTGEKHD